MDDRAAALAAEFWPGPLTLILPATARAVAELGPVVHAGSLGVRVPDHPVALAILSATARPIAASSPGKENDNLLLTAAQPL